MLELILNASVYAPERLGVVNILTCGNRLVYVGPEHPEISGAFDVSVVDLEGMTVLPGLIDCHAHITGGGGEAGYGSRVPPSQVSSFSKAGVTSVVGLLGTDDLTQGTGSVVAGCYGLRSAGLSAWCFTGGYHYPPTTLTGSIRSDIVYIDPVIGFGELAISDHRSSQVSLNELLRVASECHVAGVMTGKAGVAHLHLGDGLRGLELVREAIATSEIPARVFNPTHVNRRRALFDEACDLASRGSTIDVTAFPVDDGEDALTASDAVERFLRNGFPSGKITVSSDGGGCLPEFDDDGVIERMSVGSAESLLSEARILMQRDLEIEEWLPAFTTNVASILRLNGKGRIRAGFDADLLVVDSDGGLRDVMARGRWHVRNGETLIHGMLE